MKNALSLSTFSEYAQLAANQSHDVHLSIHLEACPGVEWERPHMSVLFVLDISSSMAGEPLEQVLEVVDSTVGLLSPDDRVGVMTFAAGTQEVIDVREAGEEHLRRLRRRLRTIRHRKWTNFEAALKKAERMMPAPRKGERQVVIFLSDGCPSVGDYSEEGLAKIVESWQGISLSTLGFAHHHNPELMELLSKSGGGRHHFVADPLACEYEFASALVTEQAVVATDVEVIITPEDGTKVQTTLGLARSSERDGETIIDLSNFSAGARQFAVTHLEVDTGEAGTKQPLAQVRVRYFDERKQEGVELRQDLEVSLEGASGRRDDKVVSHKLIAAAEMIRRHARRLARQGQKKGAAVALARMIDAIEGCPSYGGDDGSVLGEVYEDLREEHKILDRADEKKHRDYTCNNRVDAYDNTVNLRLARPGNWTARASGPKAGPKPPATMKLIFLSGDRAGEEVAIEEGLIVGRSRVADIIVDDEAISRRHVQFLTYGDTPIVRDLGTPNGTFVNGKRVHRSKLLSWGDVITIGDTRMKLER